MGTSAYDIVNRALRINGVIASLDSGDAQDVNDAFTSLNMMIEAWSLEDLMCYYLISNSFTATIGQASYTIGEGGEFDCTRPLEIVQAFCTVGQIDYPLEIISHEEYQNVSMKTLSSVPRAIYYQPNYPLGTVYFYPVPNVAYPVGISQSVQLTKFSELRHELSLPPGYLKALIWNLAVEIAPEYGKAVDEITAKKAIESKELLKGKNQKIPQLHLESMYLGHGVTAIGGGNGRFNIFSGF